METQESLRRKLSGAEDLKSVVRTMKALAAANIMQYEMAVNSLGDYYRTVSLGIIAYFRQKKINSITEKQEPKGNNDKLICAIVFGSDQGLVGQFNDYLANFVSQSLQAFQGEK
jgi:F-type H+-transporting ATPase subunit gamma